MELNITEKELRLKVSNFFKEEKNMLDYIDRFNNLVEFIYNWSEQNEGANIGDIESLIRKKMIEISTQSRKINLERRDDLNNQTYNNQTFDEKVKYWSGRFHQQMRWQGESGLDEYAIFSPEWYESTSKFEPDFDKIMDEVFEKYLGTVWSKYEFLKRIGKIK